LSENQIIRDYGLSYPTVTRALRELAYEGFLLREWGKGTFVSDFSTRGRIFNRLKHKRIGIFSSYPSDVMITSIMFIEMINGMIAQSHNMGHEIEIIPEVALKVEGNEMLKQFERYDGVILLGDVVLNNQAIKEFFIKRNKPFVVTSCALQDPNLFVININEEKAPFMAVNYLKKKGHKKIAFVSGYDKVDNHPQYKIFYKTVDSKGFKSPTITLKGTENDDEIKKIISTVNNVSAAYIMDETTASKMLALLKRARINVPGDIALISFDTSSYCMTTDPPLTSVAYSRYKMGVSAIKLLTSQIELSGKRPKTITIKLDLIERGSVKNITGG